MQSYIDLVKDVFENGSYKENRTEIQTPHTVFGRIWRHNLQDGFPLLTTKKMPFKSVLAELIWFLEGSDDERRLAELTYGKDRSELEEKRTIWTDNYEAPYWQNKEYKVYIGKKHREGINYLGNIYGVQWRQFGWERENDQLLWLVNELKTNPSSRKMIMLSFHPDQRDFAVLTACHTMVQFQVQDGKLNCAWNQSSSDLFLGLPFNIASYALLTHILAHLTGYEVGELICFLGDVHIYENSVEALKEQCSRKPKRLPKLEISDRLRDIEDVCTEDFALVGYESYDRLSVKMAV